MSKEYIIFYILGTIFLLGGLGAGVAFLRGYGIDGWLPMPGRQIKIISPKKMRTYKREGWRYKSDLIIYIVLCLLGSLLMFYLPTVL